MKFYVYVLFRVNGVPLYVGKGSGRRSEVHVSNAYHGDHSNIRLRRAIEDARGPLPYVRVREGLTEDEAFATEIALIAAIGREADGGPLVNETDGGKGVGRGRVMPAYQRKLISAALKGRSDFNEAGRRASPIFQRGQPLPEDVKEKMRRSKIGKKLTTEHRAKLAWIRLGKPLSDEHRAAISRGNKGLKHRPMTEERKLEIAADMKTRLWWRTPDGRSYRASMAKCADDVRGRIISR